MGNADERFQKFYLGDSKVLVSTLISAIQEIVVLKEIMKAKGVWDEGLYKTLRRERMLQDNSSAGADPWQGFSYFPYAMEEGEFLRRMLGASEAEVEAYEKERAFLMTLT